MGPGMRWAAALVLAAFAVTPAHAQPAPDPIGDVLSASTLDPDEADAAPAPTSPPPPAAALSLPSIAAPSSPAQDQAFDTRVRASQTSAQRFQGPLDGGWTLSGASGELYVLQLADHDGVLEGAWRDPRRPGALNASGFIDQLERTPDGLVLRFAAVVARLHGSSDGRLAGALVEDGRTTAISLSRRGP